MNDTSGRVLDQKIACTFIEELPGLSLIVSEHSLLQLLDQLVLAVLCIPIVAISFKLFEDT